MLMKKLILGSVALTFFSISIIIFQISCKKEVIAQTLNQCSETGNINLSITIPSNKTTTAIGQDNGVYLESRYTAGIDSVTNSYTIDCLIGGSHSKSVIFKNIIPGNYKLTMHFGYLIPTGSNHCSAVKSIIVEAGKTYNLSFIATDFPCP
jgi:hypothetical protein